MILYKYYYIQYNYNDVASLLLRRWNRASEMKCIAIQQFTSLIAPLQGLYKPCIIVANDGYL